MDRYGILMHWSHAWRRRDRPQLCRPHAAPTTFAITCLPPSDLFLLKGITSLALLCTAERKLLRQILRRSSAKGLFNTRTRTASL